MNRTDGKAANALRKRAEDLLAKSTEAFNDATIKNNKTTAQELAVYQAELELQNEELRDTQLALMRARDRFAALYEHAPAAYVILDQSGIMRRTNRAWRTMMNLDDHEDVKDKPFTDFLAPEDAPIFLARFRAFFQDPSGKQIMVRMQPKGRAPIHARIEACPRVSGLWGDAPDNGESKELWIIASDISDLHAARQHIENQNRELRKTSEREIHINAILDTIRKINQLIAREDDRQRLIQSACEILVNGLGFHNAWIALTDDTGGKVVATGDAGFNGGFALLLQQLTRGEFTSCMKQSLGSVAPIVVKNPLNDCYNCPVSCEYEGRSGIVRRLRFDGATYGVLAVSLDIDDAKDPEVRALFEELSDDIAFALHKIDMVRRSNARLSAIIEILQYRPENLQDYLDQSLEQAIAITQSKFGFIYFYDANRREFILNSWSKNVMKECAIADPQTCYALDNTGIWGEVVRQGRSVLINDFQADHPLKKGYPKEHVKLTRFLSIPVFYRGQIVATLGVANKTSEYRETDTLELKLLMETVWKSVLNIKNEQMVRERERYLQTILDTTADGFWALDAKGRIIEVNKAYCAMSGYTHDEIIGMGIPDLDAVETPMNSSARIARIIANGSEIFETRHRRKDGTTWAVEISTTWLDEAGGRFICFCRDLTERKRAEAKIRHFEKTESLGRMAGAIAHHYNNLLAVVMGNLELAMGDLPVDGAPVKLLTDAMQAGRRASKLSGMMLAYLGMEIAEREPLNLADTCRRALSLLRMDMPAHISMETDMPEPEPMVKANADQIKRVLENLLINGWEAINKKSGTIFIRVFTASAEDIPKNYRRPVAFQPGAHRYACLEMRDTGSGIPEDAVEKLYDPFYTTRFTGRGLGLTVALGIIKSHGGCITLTSTPDRGSTFRVFLPQTTEPALTKKSAPPAATAARFENTTVLLVDDDPMVLRSSARMLSRLGVMVMEAASGNEAIEILRKNECKIHCVLTDLTMPEKNGWDVIAALRSISPEIPIILASGYDHEHVIQGAHAEMPQAFLSKPYQSRELKQALAAALKGNQ
jgi:PAS domain S-box-containing protein